MSLSMNSPYHNICRTCLSDSVTVKPLFSLEEILNQSTTLSNMLMECASVLVIKDDGLPDNICFNCAQELQRSFLFKRLCETSDATLRNRTISMEVQIDEAGSVSNIPPKAEFSVEENELKPQFDSCSEGSSFDGNCSDGVSGESCQQNKNKKKVRKKDAIEITEQMRKSYKCEECNTAFLGLGRYWKHMAKAHGQLFTCDICQKELKSEPSLKQHKITEHAETTKKRKGLGTNSGIVRKRNLPRTCEICNKTFRFHSNLERHKLIHTGEKPYLCNVCGKGFGQMSYLKIHSFIHTGEKPYKCQMCEKSFAAPGTLMTHVRIHTGERPHVCKICGKDFPQSGYLSAHIRTHTGEKPVECKVCHRRFNQSGRLVVHMRIHSGEKPYSCKDCGRSFAVKGTLKKHIRTHTGERPYICSVCGQAFAQSGTLATHMKVHNPK